MRLRVVLPVVCLLQLAVATPGFADALPIDECATKQKKEGEPCKDAAQRDGACGKISFTAYNHATNPPTPSERTYFGCRSGEKPTAPTATKKGCSAAPWCPAGGAPAAFLGLGLALVLVVARRGARNAARVRRSSL